MWQLSLFLMLNVNLQSCTPTELVLNDEETTYNIDFFNVIFFNEESRMKACEYLQMSENIQLEEEPLIDNAYYIYVDHQMIQEKIIDENLGRVNLSFDGYRHDFSKQEILTVAPHKPENKQNRSILILSTLLFLFIICAFIAWRL